MTEQALHIAVQKQLEDFSLDVNLTIPQQGITAVYGPSGSGKTTLLRCVAGLEKAQGKIRMGAHLWQDEQRFLPPEQRAVGYVFQDARLFPHLNVKDNLQFGWQRVSPPDRYLKLDDIIAWLGLDKLLTRSVTGLSGGEKQRVAIGRALATNPQLLLMDEPLSALDQTSKTQILPYLEALHRELSIPILYVSHAMAEVARLADHLILMEQGKVVSDGPLSTVLSQADQAFHHSDESGVVISATVVERAQGHHLLKADFDGGSLWLKDQNEAIGDHVRIRLLARDVSLSHQQHTDHSILNALQGHIDSVSDGDHPAVKLVRVAVGQHYILARLTGKSFDELGFKLGQRVWVQVKSVAVLG